MIFIDACFGKKTPYTPVWMMRQAGRYLPQYLRVRALTGDFLSLCKNPQRAAQVTIQPVEILNVDAAILFSDILVVPLEMGMDLKFGVGEGPSFSNPIATKDDLDKLLANEAAERLEYVYESIRLTRKDLTVDKALIGFCGAPWTLATYMVEGKGTKTYNKIKKLLYTNPAFLHEILAKVTEVLKLFLERQIQSGVNAVQIFDSWANALEESAFFKFSWRYTQEICSFLKAKYPHIPVIAFPKGVGCYLDKIEGEFDVFGVDWSTPIELAKEKLGSRYVLQGNMEPAKLYSKKNIDSGVKHIVDIMQNRRHIFNLGHGILPDVSVENAKYFINLVHEKTKI